MSRARIYFRVGGGSIPLAHFSIETNLDQGGVESAGGGGLIKMGGLWKVGAGVGGWSAPTDEDAVLYPSAGIISGAILEIDIDATDGGTTAFDCFPIASAGNWVEATEKWRTGSVWGRDNVFPPFTVWTRLIACAAYNDLRDPITEGDPHIRVDVFADASPTTPPGSGSLIGSFVEKIPDDSTYHDYSGNLSVSGEVQDTDYIWVRVYGGWFTGTPE